MRKRQEALAGGARPGKPLASAAQSLSASSSSSSSSSASSNGNAANGGAEGNANNTDILSSVQGISHGDVIVGQLKGQLLGFTQSLKGILQARSESMKAQADRRQQFGAVRDLGRPLTFGQSNQHQQSPTSGFSSGGVGLRPSPTAAASSSITGGGRGTAGGPNGIAAAAAASAPLGGTRAFVPSSSGSQQHHQQPQNGGNDHSVVNFGGGGSSSSSSSSNSAAAFQQLSQAQLVPEAALLNARAQDMQQIERHINDLGQLFTRLATVVAEQGALVERIEDNTENALANMEAGHAQLQRYWERVSSNRGLALRVASTIIVTAVLFALFGA